MPHASRLTAAGPHNRMRRISTAATAARHEPAPPGNTHSTDTHTHAVDLLTDALGATVIATYPTARALLPAPDLLAVRCDHDPLWPGRFTLCADCQAVP
jgi:hypothetical protein